MEEIIEKYIRLRDIKDKMRAEFKEKTARIDAALEKTEGLILKLFSEQGLDSVRTGAGTAFKKVNTFVSVADWDATLAFIRDNDMWPMLRRDVSKSAVEEYRAEHQDVPPGIALREEVTINVRRS